MKRREFLQLVTAATAGTFLPACATVAAPAATSTKTKRGLGLSTKDKQWAEKLKRCGAHWFYTWNFPPPEQVPADFEFVPMLWNRRREETFPKLRAELEQNKLKTLLGYNEPDQKEQSNITVEEALAQWPKLMELGVRLGSPACAHPDKDWMQAFMKGVEERKLRVDFVTVHSYGGPNADALMKRLATVHKMFGRPLWVTEFAVGDWNAKTRVANKYHPEQVAEFVRKVLPQLDACKFVERYAWFPAKPDSAPLGPCAIFNDDGSLTPVGEAYRTT